MEEILLPSKIELTADGRKGTLTVEPCFQGYGTTLGNALRRVLLSSLPGAAVTAVKIKGAQHEFSALPGVKEDILEIILNLKSLRLKLFSDEPVRLHLSAKGDGDVTAGDIEKSSDVEVINKDLHIATLTDKKAELELEIFVGKGRGFVPIEERGKEKLELGMIAIDALYSPIRDVGYSVENVRVGEITNYDKLVMTIETDGTITPDEALDQALKILLDHFSLVLHRGATVVSEEAPAAVVEEAPAADEAAEGDEGEKKAKKTAKKAAKKKK